MSTNTADVTQPPAARRAEGPGSTANDTLARKSRDSNVVSGDHLVARALKNEGVDTIFTLCCGHIIDIYDGCVDEGIRIIDVRHEQVAAHAADGYARQTGKLGCVLRQAVIPKPGHYRASTKSLGDPRDIEKLADMVIAAERPVILIGSQVWSCRGHEAAIGFVRALDIPAYFNGAARGLLPPGDPHHFDRTRREGFDRADLIIIVGTPFDFRMGYGKRLGCDAKIVQIDMDYCTVGKNRDIDLDLVGDPGAIFAALHDAASGRITGAARATHRNWMAELRKARLAPIDRQEALSMVDGIQAAEMLRGVRGGRARRSCRTCRYDRPGLPLGR
jgi:thiamine pyrophosphate-dependent acetolactate synthase large subunit-like protein